MSILNKPLTEKEAEMGRDSVASLNQEIVKRCNDLSGIQIIAWAGDLHLHPPEGYPFPFSGFGGIYEHIDCSRQYMLCLHEISALTKKPELIVLGGDITEMGREEEWGEFSSIMNTGICEIPTLPVMGNHEHLQLPEKERMKELWSEIRCPGWPDLDNPDEFFYSVIRGGIKHIVLDTVKLPDIVMSDRQKEFLSAELKEDNLPVLIYQHAHIMPSGNWTDGALYLDKDMIRLIDECPNVMGVFSGHTHKPSLWKYRNKLYGTFPAVAYSIGTCTGWGGIILDDKGIKGVFYKELFGESYDDCIGPRYQEGKFVFMKPKSFEKSPLLNPFFWYRNPNPRKRR